MPSLSIRLTDSVAKSDRDCPAPATGHTFYWCSAQDGFGVRVSQTSRAWVFERRVGGKTVRRTLGKVTGRDAVSMRVGRELARIFSGELSTGVDRVATAKARRTSDAEVRAADALTLAVALREYVERKRRSKDGLLLKPRTKSDYLTMVQPGRSKRNGELTHDGLLYGLAEKPLAKITGDDIRQVHEAAEPRGVRRAAYAMQVLRAVLNWHGVRVPDNPLGRDVPGRRRIVLAPTQGAPTPIPPERLGAWWRAAGQAKSRVAADCLAFRLLTGTRGVEVLGDAHGNEPVRVRDVDVPGARITVLDTKNRSSHVLLLSREAMNIALRNMVGKAADEPLFDVTDPKKTLRSINRAAGMNPDAISSHDLRATFASVADLTCRVS